MKTLTLTRGLPGSGKTTWAEEIQFQQGPHETVIVNRDATRKRLFGSDGPDYYDCPKDVLWKKESLVTEACHTEIGASLKAGFDVICSDTNLPVKRCRELRTLATRAGARFEIEDFSDVPLATCLERNAQRTDKDPVPEQVIRDMHERFIRGGLAPVPDEDDSPKFKPYVRDTSKPKAILVDTDGTVACHTPHRSPYDTSRYAEDTPIGDVIDLVGAVSWLDDITIIGLSGRSEDFFGVTSVWWDENVGFCPEKFYMRASGDTRKDTIIKSEIFDEHIADRYNVIGVIDDRPSVNRMWRAKGLTTFQVGDPDVEF